MYLSAEEIATRVAELGAEIAADYEGREPVLVASLKASFVFLADLTRATPILHHIDFVELAGYTSDETGGTPAIRFLKDLDAPLEGRDVLIVEDVVDTGLTLNYLVRTFTLRSPRSLAAVTFLDRPYRRLVDGPPGPVRRLHRPRRVLRRLRLRRRREVPEPAGPARPPTAVRLFPPPRPTWRARHDSATLWGS